MSDAIFEFDISDMVKGMNLADRTVRERIERGVGKAGMQLRSDCVMDEPTVPYKEGTLRGSASVFVQDRLVSTGDPSRPDLTGDPAMAHNEPRSRDEVVAVVGYNTPYAARLHEHPEYEFTEPSAGGKFVEEKLRTRGKNYLEIIGAEIDLNKP